MDKFEQLFSTNVNDKTEKRKNGSTELTYLSWAWAWAEFKKVYPDATYEIVKFVPSRWVKDEIMTNTVPYMYDPDTGYMVNTKVTAGGLTYEMWLPVMDSSNRAMKAQPYEYTTQYGTKTVNAATMFDINKTIMRCLTKNLAMFGLGLYIYAGEDLPEVNEETKVKVQTDLLTEIEDCTDEDTLSDIYKKNKAVICKTPNLLEAITKKGKALKGAA